MLWTSLPFKRHCDDGITIVYATQITKMKLGWSHGNFYFHICIPWSGLVSEFRIDGFKHSDFIEGQLFKELLITQDFIVAAHATTFSTIEQATFWVDSTGSPFISVKSFAISSSTINTHQLVSINSTSVCCQSSPMIFHFRTLNISTHHKIFSVWVTGTLLLKWKFQSPQRTPYFFLFQLVWDEVHPIMVWSFLWPCSFSVQW